MMDDIRPEHLPARANLEEVAEAYLRHFSGKREEDSWAFSRVGDIVRDEPDVGLELTLLLLKMAKTDDVALAYVAAGPLEELLKLHGPQVIDRIEKASKSDSRIQLALSGVWGLNPGHPVFKRWYALMEKYGFGEGKRQPL